MTTGILIGAVVTLLAALIASPFLGPPSERYWRRRELSHRSEVTNLALPGAADLEVTYRGQRVRELCVVEIYIYNIGNVAITPQMFSEPILVELAQLGVIPVEVIKARLTGTASAGGDIKIGESLITIPPRLINKGEQIRLWAMTAGEATPRVTIRVADARVHKVVPQRPRAPFAVFLGCYVAGGAAGLLGTYLAGVPGVVRFTGGDRLLVGLVAGTLTGLLVFLSIWRVFVRVKD